MIRLAQREDIPEIMKIVGEIVVDMEREGNYQWNSTYPSSTDFLRDIEASNLYIKAMEDGTMVGFMCVNQIEPEEYREINWSPCETPFVVHRLAVSRNTRGQGIATQLLRFAESMSIEKNIDSIRTDTYSTNKAMNALFARLEYAFVGQIEMMGKPFKFNCYEKRTV